MQSPFWADGLRSSVCAALDDPPEDYKLKGRIELLILITSKSASAVKDRYLVPGG